MRFLKTLTVTPSLAGDWGQSIPSASRSVKSLPLPKLGLRNSCWGSGLRWCGNRRASHFLHLSWGLVYCLAGGVQFTAGIYFMMALPIFQLGSNVWTGAWNMFSGIITLLLCCFGEISLKKAQGLLLMSLVVTVVNLINLVVLEVGEWRGFLSDEDRDYIDKFNLNNLMYSAYLCTTMSTVVAMVASFLGSQHTFCFLQLRAENDGRKTSRGDDSSGHFQQEVEEEGLNLKTPGPKPHPSWVYRYNIEDKTQVKRSSSLLQQTRSSSVLGLSSALGSGSALLAPGVGRGGVGGGVGGVHGFQRMDLLNPLPKAPRDLSPPGLHLGSIPDQPELKTIKHAVIRRHNSMYAASSRTPGPNPFQPPYTFKDVTGASEIRPIVTLQRSKTVTPGAILYRSSSIQAVARSYSTAPQFRQYVARYRQADIPLHGTTGRYRKHSKARLYPDQDSGNQFCEFQAGSSFDLPTLSTLNRPSNQTHQGSWEDEHKYSSVMFQGEDGKTTVRSSRLILDSEGSSNENIKYQGMDIVTSSKERRNPSRTNSLSRDRQYYGSWENLLENSHSKSNIFNSRNYGSTGSLNSSSESDLGPAQFYQGAGHHLQLHAVHNQSYQTNTTLETCMESDEQDSVPQVQLYDIPRPSATTLKKSNSRVSSSGKLCLRVESFKKNSSSTQTDRSSTQTDRANVNKHQNNKNKKKDEKDEITPYIGQYRKASSKLPPSKPVRKNKTKTEGERTCSPTHSGNSSTSGYSSPSAGVQSKESSPPLSKTASPGQSLDILDHIQGSGSRPHSPAKSDASAEERVTVISITPHQTPSQRSSVANKNPPNQTRDKKNPPNLQGKKDAETRWRPTQIQEIKDDELEEYQIEDIRSEIERLDLEKKNFENQKRQSFEELSILELEKRDRSETEFREAERRNLELREAEQILEERRIAAERAEMLRKSSNNRIATNGSLGRRVPQSLPPPPHQYSSDPPNHYTSSPSTHFTSPPSTHYTSPPAHYSDPLETNVDSLEEYEEENYEELHQGLLRHGDNRFRGRNTGRTQGLGGMSSRSPFSRLPPVPERPSLEGRDISPIPDILPPSSPTASNTSTLPSSTPPIYSPPTASRSSRSPFRPSVQDPPTERTIPVNKIEGLGRRSSNPSSEGLALSPTRGRPKPEKKEMQRGPPQVRKISPSKIPSLEPSTNEFRRAGRRELSDSGIILKSRDNTGHRHGGSLEREVRRFRMSGSMERDGRRLREEGSMERDGRRIREGKSTDREDGSVEREGRRMREEGSMEREVGRRRSKIPMATKYMTRSEDEDEKVEDGLETLLNLLGGAAGRGVGRGGLTQLPPDIVSGTPTDPLQYLSQLELVARKLKDQLIKQKQDDLPAPRPKTINESEC